MSKTWIVSEQHNSGQEAETTKNYSKIEITSNLTEDSEIVADHFNNYFANVCSDLAKKDTELRWKPYRLSKGQTG